MSNFDRSNTPWVMNPSGGRWYLIHPEPEDFSIEDIAHNLSNINRFNGAVPLSVADHSISVANYLSEWHHRPDLAFQGLMHDATEAVVGDMVSPLKELLPEFSMIEGRLWSAIARRFGLPVALDPLVLRADKEIAALEAFHAFSHAAGPEERWWLEYPIDLEGVTPMPETVHRTGTGSKKRFLSYFKDLTKNA